MSVSKKQVNIVWLKRDLRITDHIPFAKVETDSIPYLIVHCFEPSLIGNGDTSERHLQFCYYSLLNIQDKMKEFNKVIHLHYCEALQMFESINNQFLINTVFSYQESGIRLTYERDLSVKSYFNTHEIAWKQFVRNGVARGLKNRINWDKFWKNHIDSQITINTYSKSVEVDYINNHSLPTHFIEILSSYNNLHQKPNEDNAWLILNSFLSKRGKNYYKHISKPSLSRDSCSRLSPYIAWGNISIKQIYQETKQHPSYKKHKRAFTGFLTRLKWNSHFRQKFEMECRYETECINKGYELMPQDNNPSFVDAWKEGETGYPLLDACMKCLKKTGWINFRMRAMLVSFLTHNLSCDWRLGAQHLARLFLDYEPGIHYPQIQMQAGTTGINTIRMYNPTKQAKDNDAKGVFIKEWIPILRNVPDQFIHTPWEMTMMDQIFCGVTIGVDYPFPIIDLKESAKVARDKIWGFRKSHLVQSEQVRIIKKHVRDQNRKV